MLFVGIVILIKLNNLLHYLYRLTFLFISLPGYSLGQIGLFGGNGRTGRYSGGCPLLTLIGAVHQMDY